MTGRAHCHRRPSTARTPPATPGGTPPAVTSVTAIVRRSRRGHGATRTSVTGASAQCRLPRPDISLPARSLRFRPRAAAAAETSSDVPHRGRLCMNRTIRSSTTRPPGIARRAPAAASQRSGGGRRYGHGRPGAGRYGAGRPAAPQGEFALPVSVTPALPGRRVVRRAGHAGGAAGRRSTRQGVTLPFPIQAATLPNSLAGRDVLGRGRTGSGKTLAFGLALLARTAGQRAEPRQPLALVLVPTRELAQQVTDALTPYARTVRLRLGHGRRRDVDRPAGLRAPRRDGGRRGHARAAQGPDRPGRLPAGPGRDHGAGRGRPDGRHGLHAAGHRAARPGRGPAASACCSPPPSTATSTGWSGAS